MLRLIYVVTDTEDASETEEKTQSGNRTEIKEQ